MSSLAQKLKGMFGHGQPATTTSSGYLNVPKAYLSCSDQESGAVDEYFSPLLFRMGADEVVVAGCP